jgi:hypothetical protein
MNLKNFTIALMFCGMGLFTISCEKEITDLNTNPELGTQSSSDLKAKPGSLKLKADALAKSKFDCATDLLRQRLISARASRAVTPSECGPTDLDAAIIPYVREFGDLETNTLEQMAALPIS